MSKGIDVSWGNFSKPIWIFLITESKNRCCILGTCGCLLYESQPYLYSNYLNVFRACVPNKSRPLVTNRVKQELTAKPISLKFQLGFCSIPTGTHSLCEVTSDCLSFEYCWSLTKLSHAFAPAVSAITQTIPTENRINNIGNNFIQKNSEQVGLGCRY